MVSGFFTSPCDHSRIFSGLASEMRIALNESGSFGFSKKLKMSFTVSPYFPLVSTAGDRLDGAARLTHADFDVVRLDGGHGLGPGLPAIPEPPVGAALLAALQDGELVGRGAEAGRLAGVARAADAVVDDLGLGSAAGELGRRLRLELLLARGDHGRPAGSQGQQCDDVLHA